MNALIENFRDSVDSFVSSVRRNTLPVILAGGLVAATAAIAPAVIRAQETLPSGDPIVNGDPIVKDEHNIYLPLISSFKRNPTSLIFTGSEEVWGMHYSHYTLQGNEEFPEGSTLSLDLSVTPGKVVDIYSATAKCTSGQGGYDTTCTGAPGTGENDKNAIRVTVATNTSLEGGVEVKAYGFGQYPSGEVFYDEVKEDNYYTEIVKE